MRLFLELPVLPAHGAVLVDLLRLQPLDDAVHVETVRTLAPHCKTPATSQSGPPDMVLGENMIKHGDRLVAGTHIVPFWLFFVLFECFVSKMYAILTNNSALGYI